MSVPIINYDRMRGEDCVFMISDPLAVNGQEDRVFGRIAPIMPGARAPLQAEAGTALTATFRAVQGVPGDANHVPVGWNLHLANAVSAAMDTSLIYRLDAHRVDSGVKSAMRGAGNVRFHEGASL